MHSIAASASVRALLSGLMRSMASFRVFEGANAPFACCHFSKNGRMSVARSLMTGKFSSGPISRCPLSATFDTWVRQGQRGRPLTVMAQEPHMPTRQAKREDSGGSGWRCTKGTTSSTGWVAPRGSPAWSPAGVHAATGRVGGEKVSPQLGTIVTDNRGGGGGAIGANDVAHSAPDGYSILLGSTTPHVLVPPVMANPPYDPVKDFAAGAVLRPRPTPLVVSAPGAGR